MATRHAPGGSQPPWGLARAGAVPWRRRRPSGPGALRGVGGLGGLGWVGPARARGSGARGSPPAAPGRRADGVSKVTLRTPTVSGGGGNTYEPFGLLPGRAPGERQPLGASGFRRLVPGRAESSPLGRRAWGLLRNRSCLKCETIPRTQGSVTSVSLP